MDLLIRGLNHAGGRIYRLVNIRESIRNLISVFGWLTTASRDRFMRAFYGRMGPPLVYAEKAVNIFATARFEGKPHLRGREYFPLEFFKRG